ncbi:hypothetical protein [Paraburkholderia kururiensis]|uniref:hypothetical protein n=1 Tax=Paraburkholderia kururiensis TaxID=984307 RepID=UPI000345D3BC|nr:hypothetical protein [Paraburkholderia kururiensis]
MSATPSQGAKAIPKYRLLETAYIDDRIYDPKTTPIDPETNENRPLIIAYEGVPGPHMEPVNDAARAIFKKHNPTWVDPIESLPINE